MMPEHHFQFDLAGAIQFVADVGDGLTRERADYLVHAACLEQGGQTNLAVVSVIAVDGQVAGTGGDQPVDEFGWHAFRTKATDHDGRTVVQLALLSSFQTVVRMLVRKYYRLELTLPLACSARPILFAAAMVRVSARRSSSSVVHRTAGAAMLMAPTG